MGRGSLRDWAQPPPYLWAVRSVDTWPMTTPGWEEAAKSGFPRSSQAAGWVTSSATGELGREENTKAQKCSLKFHLDPKQGLSFPFCK